MNNDCDIYWLAGLLEGEGYFGLRRQGRDLVLQVGGVDRDVIERAQRIAGHGFVKERHLPSGKIYYGLTITKQSEVERVMLAVLPLMGSRRGARIRECVAAHALVPAPKRDWTHCKNGHALAGANLRIVQDGKYSKRRCLECGRLRQRKHRASAH